MSTRVRITRFLSGLCLIVILLLVAFASLLPWIHTWGAAPEEVARVYPGDELQQKPIIVWTHGITIHARPEQVWPWIAQIGDTRAAFYSYTFIENLFTLATHSHRYQNADRIVPEWQDPQPGLGIIDDMLKIKTVQPGEWMLASTAIPEINWTWLWSVQPQGDSDTRLLVRMRIEMPGGGEMAAIGNVIDVSGFVMEVGMMHGIKDRAEGRVPPAYGEILGIGLWLLAFAAGVLEAVRFVTRRDWRLPLLVGLLSVLALLILTFIQPALWVRGLLDAGLLIVVWLTRQADRQTQPALPDA